MPIIRISRKVFQQLPQDELATYAENILNRCTGNPAYANLASLLAELQPAVEAYNAALIAARNRSLEAVGAKRQARKVLSDILDRVANALEYSAPDEVHVLNAGMQPGIKRQIRLGEMPAPQSLQATLTGNPGEVLLLLGLPAPTQVQTNAVEYSADNGATWVNGTYDKRNRILITGLPSGQGLQFRARSIGTRGRVSAWSATVLHKVL